ncbi:MAG: 2-amino-4-hydroxy-6-hydroxymethyldihydropteridine diphosphokinase [Pseudomonadota bacterium]
MTNTQRKALIGLGSNKAWHGKSPAEVLSLAAKALGSLGQGVRLSPLYCSPAWPDPSQPEYRNAVVCLESALEPHALLAGLQVIEAGFGRVRSGDPALRYAPRTLDLDLLAVGDLVMEDVDLQLPHPRVPERDFVLLPLRDVEPAWQHPITGQSVSAMIKALPIITCAKA